tara:strand:- start:229 stop:690 length:462 start_codon:yes stop_codon:yes gene_type:complete
MIDMNVGPDIILYLSNIISQEEKVFFSEGIVAQFSEHDDSMSIGYGTDPLTIGYWLGRIWAFNEILAKKNIHLNMNKVLPQCSGYLILSGFRVIIKLFIKGKFLWTYQAFKEVLFILYQSIKNRFFIKSFFYVFKISFNRYMRFKFKALPRLL